MKKLRLLFTAVRMMATALLIGCVLVMVAFGGCHKNPPTTVTTATVQYDTVDHKPVVTTTTTPRKDVPDDPVAAKPAPAVQEETAPPASGPSMFPYPIYFDFDKSKIRNNDKTKQTFILLAQALRDNPSKKLRIEGNCDERGTREYNLMLGGHRAIAAKHKLMSFGIESRRFLVITNGKEKLACIENTEACHQMNRRADFIFTE